tara:strand:+ start:1406 stop:1633 length:228 start_codon:yes stop_codon:yes gene_type:complete
MELLDTPNPNAKKIELDDNNNLKDQLLESGISDDLYKIDGVDSVFFGPGFITITKSENVDWESINQDIINIFDKL